MYLQFLGFLSIHYISQTEQCYVHDIEGQYGVIDQLQKISATGSLSFTFDHAICFVILFLSIHIITLFLSIILKATFYITLKVHAHLDIVKKKLKNMVARKDLFTLKVPAKVKNA